MPPTPLAPLSAHVAHIGLAAVTFRRLLQRLPASRLGSPPPGGLTASCGPSGHAMRPAGPCRAPGARRPGRAARAAARFLWLSLSLSLFEFVCMPGVCARTISSVQCARKAKQRRGILEVPPGAWVDYVLSVASCLGHPSPKPSLARGLRAASSGS